MSNIDFKNNYKPKHTNFSLLALEKIDSASSSISKESDIFRDTVIVCIGNCMTSFTAGFAIFSVLGFMAKETGLKVEDVAV